MEFPNKKILCAGEVLWDVLGENRKPGGAPLNVAMHLHRLGNDVNIVSRIGNDYNGKELASIIASAGLSLDHLQVDSTLPTSEVLVAIDEKGNAKFEIREPVAWDNLEFSSGLENLSKLSGIIIYGTLAARNRSTRETIIKTLVNGAVKIIDVNLRAPYTNKKIIPELIYAADIAKLNNDELKIIAGWDRMNSENEEELAAWIAEKYMLKMVCVTRGENGALIYNDKTFSQHPGFKVKVADTVGAGDAFLAGLASSLIRGSSTNDSLKFACATGAFVASRVGGTPDYEVSDIDNIINNSN